MKARLQESHSHAREDAVARHRDCRICAGLRVQGAGQLHPARSGYGYRRGILSRGRKRTSGHARCTRKSACRSRASVHCAAWT